MITLNNQTDVAQTQLPVGRWVIDPAHSAVSFEARHLGLSNIKGTFNRLPE
ncbi:MAG: YceI family protein [Solirubrobacteraceae bacterium]